MSANNHQSRLKELITKGKEQGYLTYAQVNDHLPDDIANPDQVEDIIRMINDIGIPVSESAPDGDTLFMADAADEAVEHVAGALGQADALDLGRAPVVEQAEFDRVGVDRRDGDVGAARHQREAQRVRAAAVGSGLFTISPR